MLATMRATAMRGTPARTARITIVMEMSAPARSPTPGTSPSRPSMPMDHRPMPMELSMSQASCSIQGS